MRPIFFWFWKYFLQPSCPFWSFWNPVFMAYFNFGRNVPVQYLDNKVVCHALAVLIQSRWSSVMIRNSHDIFSNGSRIFWYCDRIAISFPYSSPDCAVLSFWIRSSCLNYNNLLKKCLRRTSTTKLYAAPGLGFRSDVLVDRRESPCSATKGRTLLVAD